MPEQEKMSFWTMVKKICPCRYGAYNRWYNAEKGTLTPAMWSRVERTILDRHNRLSDAYDKPQWVEAEAQRYAEKLRFYAKTFLAFTFPQEIRKHLMRSEYRLLGKKEGIGDRVPINQNDFVTIEIDVPNNCFTIGEVYYSDAIVYSNTRSSGRPPHDDIKALYPLLKKMKIEVEKNGLNPNAAATKFADKIEEKKHNKFESNIERLRKTYKKWESLGFLPITELV